MLEGGAKTGWVEKGRGSVRPRNAPTSTLAYVPLLRLWMILFLPGGPKVNSSSDSSKLLFCPNLWHTRENLSSSKFRLVFSDRHLRFTTTDSICEWSWCLMSSHCYVIIIIDWIEVDEFGEVLWGTYFLHASGSGSWRHKSPELNWGSQELKIWECMWKKLLPNLIK